MKKILLFLVLFILIGCNKRNVFNDYEDFLILLNNYKFENVSSFEYSLKLSENDEVIEYNSEFVKNEEVYFFKVDGSFKFNSYYFDEYLKIKNEQITVDKVLINSYVKFVEKYSHINILKVEKNDIEKITKKDSGFEVALNKNGSFYYFKDVLKRNNKFIELNDFSDGMVNIKINGNTLEVSGSVTYKNTVINIEEKLTIKDSYIFEIEEWGK
ncbi:MAG: hypothetical protein MR601_01535 [Erysipelotrichaceae bacterium]|nr:hypothetical protein [Erysipelotrichaceae bacterium]